MVTLKDIAEEVGVTISVVSRAISPKPDKNARVSEKTRNRIISVAEKMGYQRNRIAEFMKRGKAATIGVFIPAVPNRLIADLMFGISTQAVSHGFPVNFYFGITAREYKQFMGNISDVSHSGIISYPFQFSPHNKHIFSIIEKYQENGGHILFLNVRDQNEKKGFHNFPIVYIDDYEGGRLAASRFLKRKCKSFLVEDDNFPARANGFTDWLEKNGRTYTVFSLDEFRHILETRNDTHWQLPVGIFALTDEHALTIIEMCLKEKLEVGKDVLIIGFDDLYLTDKIHPALTTIHQPFKEEGEIAVTELINTIYGGKEKTIKVKPRLVVRETA